MYLRNNEDLLFSHKGVLFSFGMIIFLFFNSVYSIANFITAIIFSVFFTIVFGVLYVLRISKRNLEKKDYYLIYGLLGTFLSFVFAFFTAWYHIGTVVQKIIVFIIISFILLVLFFLMEIIFKRKKEKKNNGKKTIAYTGISMIGAIIGLFFSKYLRYIGKEISLEIIFICASLLFSIFYCFLIKYKKLENNKNQKQSGDSSVIDS